MQQKDYPHKGRNWQLLIPNPRKIILLTPSGKIVLPPFRISCSAEHLAGGILSQICEGPDGWRLKVEISPNPLSIVLSLIISKDEFEISLDAPQKLCFDLLEIFASFEAD